MAAAGVTMPLTIYEAPFLSTTDQSLRDSFSVCLVKLLHPTILGRINVCQRQV